MPRFSAFTRFSHLRFSRRLAHGERFYRELIRNQGDGANYSSDPASLVAAENYALAMGLARARYTADRAGHQYEPHRAVEMLPSLEWEFGLVPLPTATIEERQHDVAVAAKVARGARLDNVTRVLRELLGDDFIAYLPTAKGAGVPSTTDPANAGTWEAPGSPKAVYQLTTAITLRGSPTIALVAFVAGQDLGFSVGQRVTLDIGDTGRSESVIVNLGGTGGFGATFTQAHAIGAQVVIGRAPNMSSTKRHNLVVLSAAAMHDAEKRRKTNRALHRLLRGTSTWSLAEPSGVGTAGPFRVGHGTLGHTPIGTVSY